MSEKKSYESWRMSDEFWEAVKDDIPLYERDSGVNTNANRALGARRRITAQFAASPEVRYSHM